MKTTAQRILVLGSFAAVGLVVILVRVAFLSFSGRTGEQHDESPIRGIIKDRRGVTLALTEEASTIAVAPGEVIDSEFTAARLEQWVGVPKEELRVRIEANSGRLHVPLARQVDNYVADRIMDLRLPGVHRAREFRRVYPFGNLASNLLGFTGREANSALSGLELAYNRVLVSSSGRGATVLHLSIDALIQKHLEEELQRGMLESRSKRAVGIVIKVRTGEILAMAVRPTYDPNAYSQSKPFERTNWAARFNYEPGSTVKVFMAAMLLNERLVDPREKFRCNGSIAFGETVVSCKTHNRVHAHGYVNLRDILRKSCNVGIITAMQRVPPQKIHAYLDRLGFGRRTEVFPDAGLETPGYLPPFASWVPSSRYYIPIGQSFSVTPLQLLRAGASLANGGHLVRPFVVSRVTDELGEQLQRAEVETVANPFAPEVNAAVLDMMRSVVEQGTGGGAIVRGLPVAGKTGTGQKATAAGYVEKYVASFMGFFPAARPEYGMLVLYDEPAGHAGGGSLAAPVFGRVLTAIRPIIDRGVRTIDLADLKLAAPRPGKDPATDAMPDVRGLSARAAILTLPSGTDVRLFGSGMVFRQMPAPGTPFAPRTAVQLYLDTN